MRLATADGRHVTINKRGWPLAGLESPVAQTPGQTLLKLAALPSGEQMWATYATIYRTNPWVFACVQLIARNLSRMPLKTYQLQADGQRERVRGDLPGVTGAPSAGARLDRLFAMPEPTVGIQTWLRKVLMDRAVYGNSLIVKERNGAGYVTALWHVPWNKVTVVPGENVPVLLYRVGNAGSNLSSGVNYRDYSPLDVIHVGRGTNLDVPFGASPLASLKYTLSLHDAIQRHLVAYFQNQARPSGVLKVQPAATEKQIEQMRKEVRRLYTAPEAAGKVMITSAEFQAMTEAPGQSAVIDLAKHSREEICAAYSIPPPLVGILDKAIKSNVSELRSQLVRDVIGSWAAEVEDDIMSQLILSEPVYANLFVEFDMSEALRPDLEARAAVYAQMRAVYTPNETRNIENLPPLDVEGADTVWMPSGQVGLGLEPDVPVAPPVPSGTAPLEVEPGDGSGSSPQPADNGDGTEDDEADVS